MALLIKDKLRKPLAEAVLFGELSKSGGRVEVTVENGEVVLHIEELTPA
jgi:ATP-dependent Clp protease ATP-binding subunit ClpA